MPVPYVADRSFTHRPTHLPITTATQQKVQYGIEVHTAHRVFLFRAADRAQQLGWIRAIQARIQLASENDLISVAELMICDEEQARARRCVGCP